MGQHVYHVHYTHHHSYNESLHHSPVQDSTFMRYSWIRLSPIVQDSSLLLLLESVCAVSQSQFVQQHDLTFQVPMLQS